MLPIATFGVRIGQKGDNVVNFLKLIARKVTYRIDNHDEGIAEGELDISENGPDSIPDELDDGFYDEDSRITITLKDDIRVNSISFSLLKSTKSFTAETKSEHLNEWYAKREVTISVPDLENNIYFGFVNRSNSIKIGMANHRYWMIFIASVGTDDEILKKREFVKISVIREYLDIVENLYNEKRIPLIKADVEHSEDSESESDDDGFLDDESGDSDTSPKRVKSIPSETSTETSTQVADGQPKDIQYIGLYIQDI